MSNAEEVLDSIRYISVSPKPTNHLSISLNISLGKAFWFHLGRFYIFVCQVDFQSFSEHNSQHTPQQKCKAKIF